MLDTTQEIQTYFHILGLESLDALIFTTLIQMGNQPASTVARRVNTERTKVYRHLKKMSKLGIIQTSQSRWITTFYINSTSGLEQLIQTRLANASKIERKKTEILDHLQKISRTDIKTPKVRLYDQHDEINLAFADMLEEIRIQKLLFIRMFASNTFDEQVTSDTVSGTIAEFFDQLKSSNVHIETFLWNGGLVMERIEKTTHLKELLRLPTTPSSIHIFIIGYIVYIVIYRDDPIAIKIENELLSDVFQLLLDQI